MNSCCFPVLSLAVFLGLSVSGGAQTRGAVERFWVQANADSWSVYDASDEQYYYPSFYEDEDPDYNSIYRNFIGANEFIFSSYGGSGGAFDGDHAGQRAWGVSVWVEVENAENLDFVDLAFYSTVTGRHYFSREFELVDGWQEVSAAFAGTWWIWEAGEFQEVELDDSILSGVDEFLVRCFPLSAAADGEWVGIDDFAVIPELVVPVPEVTMDGSLFGLAFDAWDAQGYSAEKSVSGLAVGDFVEMPGRLSESQGVMSLTELVPGGKAFWRVGCWVEFTDVPDL